MPTTSILKLAIPLSETLDLVSPLVMNHHRKVAYIAYLLGTELNLPLAQKRELLLSGIFHDVGALSRKDRIDSLLFDMNNPHQHAEIGYQLLREFGPFATAAKIIRFHHVRWDGGKGQYYAGCKVQLESHIIHLADRIAVLLPDPSVVLNKAKKIHQEILRLSGTWFHPDCVEAFGNLVDKEYFWLDAALPTDPLCFIGDIDPVEPDSAVVRDLTRLFSRVIDFRSPFTATHSSGVAACAEVLARLIGFSKQDVRLMKSAGYLHDLGKLAIPTDILDKKARLTTSEYNTMRAHSYFGYRTLQKIPALQTINLWGSLHHERLDGSGYPFHLEGNDIPFGSRVIAVSDILTALLEDRPYRKGFSPDKALKMIAGMGRKGLLDGDLVNVLKLNFVEIKEILLNVSAETLGDYRRVFEP
ncbi:MAG: HD domain-containing protein [Negativicutes bacterium]|nr:HD domain-containing protein [Negativicutes bacterium]